jgi:CRISPR/Cas system-associated protein Cas10 (large subunit of type III CRISPR-Cas system)
MRLPRHIPRHIPNKEDYRRWNIKSKRGITIEEFNKLFDKQEGRCAICGRHQIEFKRPLDVDHNHITGKIRGLLCNRCNIAIGLFSENIEVLQRAISYLVAV